MGVIERDGYTLYCTVLFFDCQGHFLGKHRKIMPTALERIIWGFGDGSTIPVFDTPIGKIGAAICWENRMPLLRTAMYAKGWSSNYVSHCNWPSLNYLHFFMKMLGLVRFPAITNWFYCKQTIDVKINSKNNENKQYFLYWFNRPSQWMSICYFFVHKTMTKVKTRTTILD